MYLDICIGLFNVHFWSTKLTIPITTFQALAAHFWPSNHQNEICVQLIQAHCVGNRFIFFAYCCFIQLLASVSPEKWYLCLWISSDCNYLCLVCLSLSGSWIHQAGDWECQRVIICILWRSLVSMADYLLPSPPPWPPQWWIPEFAVIPHLSLLDLSSFHPVGYFLAWDGC